MLSASALQAWQAALEAARHPADVVWDRKSFAILIHLSVKEYINI
jgi:hypothetical protein